MTPTTQSIRTDRIFLDLTNPRHKPYHNEEEVIAYLCRHEQVLALAKDMAQIGLNPLEAFALRPSGSLTGRKQTFVVAEGNRRMCAIKLLHDPDLAPADLRKDFRRVAEDSKRSFSTVPAVIFQKLSDLNLWLERIHGGVQGGVGRKPWNPEQKTRHIGDRKNATAQAVLDYAEKQSFISPAERKGKLTTAQRYLGNTVLREAIGVEVNAAGQMSRTRPAETFDLLINQFVRDLVENEVNSRSNSEEIKEYARSLSAMEGVSTERVAPTVVRLSHRKGSAKRAPIEPPKPKKITYEEKIAEGLQRIGSYKLQKLYFSICEVSLDKHTPLVSIGVWAFVETLTAWCGRDPKNSFTSYLSNDRLSNLGFNDRDHRNALNGALANISAYGNTTKHHDTSANFHDEQLVNDMETLSELFLALLRQQQP